MSFFVVFSLCHGISFLNFIFYALALTPQLPRGASWGAARRLGLCKGAEGVTVV